MSGADPSTAVELGGEMPFWSDGPMAEDPLIVGLLARLVPAARRVLVAGPHPVDVLRAAAAGDHELTVLTRGTPDAEGAEAALGAERARYLAGDLDRLDAGETFDLVVAAGGLEMVSSADAELRSWRLLLDLVTPHLARDGVLVVGLANDVGLDAMAGAPVRQGDDSAAVWFPDLGFDDSRPSDPDTLATALRATTGCAEVTTWSLHPGLRGACLGVRTQVPVRGRTLLSARVSAALRERFEDPLGLATRLPVSGHATALAPAFLAVTAAVDGADVLGDDAASVGDVEVAGTSVELGLLDACLAFDLVRVREVVAAYADALAGGASTSDLPQNVFLGADGAVRRLRPPGEPLEPALALLHGLDAFSRRLARLGWRHPWPVTYDDVEVTRVLLAGLGREVRREDVLGVRLPPTDVEDPTTDRDRLARENDGLRSKMAWFETTLRQRDRQLAAANAQVARTATPAQRQTNKKRARPVPPPPTRNPVVRARRVAGRVKRRLRRR